MRDIRAAKTDLLWTRDTDPESWLKKLFEYADEQGVSARDWYLSKKGAKKFGSLGTRYMAIVLSAIAGLLPIIAELTALQLPKSGLMVSLLIGIAAALVGLDRFAGYSTAWMRYMNYAQRIDAALQEFRLQWAAHMVQNRPAAAPPPPGGEDGGSQSFTTEQVEALIALTRQFLSSVSQLVAAETSEWLNEFRSNLERLDRELQVRLSEQEKASRDTVETLRPGHVFVAFRNLAAVDEQKLGLQLTSSTGKTIDEKTLVGEDSYAIMGLTAGTYVLVLSGERKQRPFKTRRMFELKAGEHLPVEVDLG